ncbi:Predicted transcriptional regulator, ArsR family [Verrucomicrobium sp. GAS474]|uniref:helix-turn-helix transcriptional regulator n=1 Tax=Verrucomicrobium sp. GAS474 TaxID=1882831 RepID=UPI000879BA55|nr:winged helix-turn-helix transcriptional regulator [Verrucomicrobium sp. GAS474]SDU17585.1 Predicted transcriptional regulator, ArsR family [Verrucomicrobium sp. GAS474]
MNSDLLQKVVKSQKYQILAEIKRSQGLSVAELCKRVNLSYMGVKQHCISLEKDGYLDTWRRPKGMGRPEKAYRLTPRAQDFFPNEFTNLTCRLLESIGEVYGPAAPEKILYQIYQTQTESMRAKMVGTSLEEKTRAFAALREAEGYMAEYYFDTEARRHQVIEFHSPLLPLLDHHPIIKEMEERLFEAVLETRVIRNEERISGLYKCTFSLFPTE